MSGRTGSPHRGRHPPAPAGGPPGRWLSRCQGRAAPCRARRRIPSQTASRPPSPAHRAPASGSSVFPAVPPSGRPRPASSARNAIPSGRSRASRSAGRGCRFESVRSGACSVRPHAHESSVCRHSTGSSPWSSACLHGGGFPSAALPVSRSDTPASPPGTGSSASVPRHIDIDVRKNIVS